MDEETIPRAAIAWLVSREHVGTPDDVVADDIARRMAGRGYSVEAIRKARQVAVDIHHANRATYLMVGGL